MKKLLFVLLTCFSFSVSANDINFFSLQSQIVNYYKDLLGKVEDNPVSTDEDWKNKKQKIVFYESQIKAAEALNYDFSDFQKKQEKVAKTIKKPNSLGANGFD